MVRFLLDTNIVSYAMKYPGGAADRRLRRAGTRDVVLSSVVEAELLFGAERLPAGARVRPMLAEFLRTVEVLPWDSHCAQHHARLRAKLEMGGTPMGVADSMIAAHALALRLTLVTNDQAFARVEGLPIQDWSKGPQRA